MSTMRTPISEGNPAGRPTGDVPATTPEELAAMSPAAWQEHSRNMWQQVLPPVPAAPTVQPRRTLADLIDG